MHVLRSTPAAIPWYRHVRVLNVLVQVAGAVGVVGCTGVLLATMLGNLRQQGLPISFAFLEQAAGFAISEGPTFHPSQTYLAAFAVGVVNTFRVAVAGIVLATALGLLVGVARLSRNWLLARLAAVYVETFRNVPLLLWLVFTYAVLRQTLPRVKNSLSILGDTILLSNRGVALSWLRPTVTFDAVLPWLMVALVAGAVTWYWAGRKTLTRPLLVALTVCLLGFGLAWITARLPAHAAVDLQAMGAFLDANQNGTWDAAEPPLAGVRVTLGSPQGTTTRLTRDDGSFEVPSDLGQIQGVELSAAAPLYWSLPRVQGFNYRGGLILSPEFVALLIGLVVYTASFIAEIVRAGILAVPRGQREAAQALGLSEAQTFRLVILPQALRVMIPPLINQYLNLTKNSSLAIAIGYPDVFSVGLTMNNQTGQAIPFIIMIMVVYLSMSLLTSGVLNLVNRRLAFRT